MPIPPTPIHLALATLPPSAFTAHVIATHPEFAMAYNGLAENGTCDSFGGMESRRVYGEWLEAGCPGTATRFIAVRANVGPIQ